MSFDRYLNPAEPDEEAPPPPIAYRSVSRLAVLSLVLAGVSSLTFLAWFMIVFPLLAVVLGVLALRRIDRLPEQLAGETLAIAGIVLAVLAGGAGGGYLMYSHGKDVPFGYLAVSYPELMPNPDQPGELIPPRAYELNEKKIYVQGYMYPGRAQQHLKEFIVSRDNGSCKFCLPNPRPTDLILVKLQGDAEVNYTTELLRLGGKFTVEETELGKLGGVVYRLDCDYLRW